MNKKDLKRLRIDDKYVLKPIKFLITMGVISDNMNYKLSIHSINYILGGSLKPVSLRNVTADKIYRGEIVLIGTPKKFYPYYSQIKQTRMNNKNNSFKCTDMIETKELSQKSINELYELYKQTLNDVYLNELYDRCYPVKKEENEPARQKIYKQQYKKKSVSLDK